MKLLYDLSIKAYGAGIHIAGLFGNKKAKEWTSGRKNWQNQLRDLPENSIWIHASSLGEFEQVKPLIEKLNERGEKILLTIFSPSGFPAAKEYELVEKTIYLPLDTKSNATEFLDLAKPKAAVFVKYDFWFNFITQLHERKVPTFFFSCTFRSNQIYFKSINRWQIELLKSCTKILVNNKESLALLQKHNFKNTGTSGDTRFDKVIQNAARATPVPEIEEFKEDKKLLILGSSWPLEEEMAVSLRNEDLKILIAPHDISEKHIQGIQKLFPDSNRFTQEKSPLDKIWILDTMGMLSNCYQYADFAFIGGGFTNKLHNTLEPATFGNMVIFGNNHSKYPEAQLLIDNGVAFSIEKKDELKAIISDLISNNDSLNQIKSKSQRLVESNKGATNKIFQEIEPYL